MSVYRAEPVTIDGRWGPFARVRMGDATTYNLTIVLPFTRRRVSWQMQILIFDRTP